MCRIGAIEDGPDLHYVPNRPYRYIDGTVTIAVDNLKYRIECYEDNEWIKFPPGSPVVIDKGCVFRVARFEFDYPMHVTDLSIKQILEKEVTHGH